MNYNKYKYTPSQFLYEVLEVEELANAPYNTPFLYTKRQKGQKEVVKRLIEELKPEELTEMLDDKKNPVTVQFWVKLKGNRTQNDNYQDQGGTLINETVT